MKHSRLYLDKNSFCTGASSTCMVMAIVFCIFGSIQNSTGIVNLLLICVIPVVSLLLYLLCIIMFGKRLFVVSCIPAVIWFAHAVLKSINRDDRIATLLFIIMYLILAVLYCCTLSGAFRYRKLAAVISFLPVLYLVFIRDWNVITGVETVSFSAIMLEMSSLSVLTGFAFALAGLRTKDIATTEKSKGIAPPLPGNRNIKSEPEPVQAVDAGIENET